MARQVRGVARLARGNGSGPLFFVFSSFKFVHHLSLVQYWWLWVLQTPFSLQDQTALHLAACPVLLVPVVQLAVDRGVDVNIRTKVLP